MLAGFFLVGRRSEWKGEKPRRRDADEGGRKRCSRNDPRPGLNASFRVGEDGDA